MKFSIKNFFSKCYHIRSSKLGASRSKWESRKICIESNQLIKIVDKSGDVNFRCIGLLSIWRNIIFLKMNDKITQTSLKMRNNKYKLIILIILYKLNYVFLFSFSLPAPYHLFSSISPENIRKLEIYWCFQGVKNETSRNMKWIEYYPLFVIKISST